MTHPIRIKRALPLTLLLISLTPLQGCMEIINSFFLQVHSFEAQKMGEEEQARIQAREDRIAATNARFEALERKQAEEKLARQVAAKAAYDAARQASADAAREGVQGAINSSVAQDIGSQVISAPASHGDF